MTTTIPQTPEFSEVRARRRRENEIREWFAVACECIRERDRAGLLIAARELAALGVGFPANFLDAEVRR